MHVRLAAHVVPVVLLIGLLSASSYGDIVYHGEAITSSYARQVDVADDPTGTWDDLTFNMESVFAGSSFTTSIIVGDSFNPGCLVTTTGDLAAGQVIDDSLDFQNYAVLASYSNTAPESWTHQFVGLKLIQGDQTYFGWASVSWGFDSPIPGLGMWVMQLDSYAYETSAGTPITVGAVPEPASLSLLGLGGLAMLRRRKASKGM